MQRLSENAPSTETLITQNIRETIQEDPQIRERVIRLFPWQSGLIAGDRRFLSPEFRGLIFMIAQSMAEQRLKQTGWDISESSIPTIVNQELDILLGSIEAYFNPETGFYNLESPEAESFFDRSLFCRVAEACRQCTPVSILQMDFGAEEIRADHKRKALRNIAGLKGKVMPMDVLAGIGKDNRFQLVANNLMPEEAEQLAWQIQDAVMQVQRPIHVQIGMSVQNRFDPKIGVASFDGANFNIPQDPAEAKEALSYLTEDIFLASEMAMLTDSEDGIFWPLANHPKEETGQARGTADEAPFESSGGFALDGTEEEAIGDANVPQRVDYTGVTSCLINERREWFMRPIDHHAPRKMLRISIVPNNK